MAVGCQDCPECEICRREIDWRWHEHIGKYSICVSCFDKHKKKLEEAQERYIESVRIDK